MSGKHFAAACSLLLCLLPAGCGGVSLHAAFFDADPLFEPIGFATIAGTSNSAIAEPRFAVLRAVVAWDLLWQEHTANILPPPALPAVNFARDMVIAVFLGSRPNACHGVSIVSFGRRFDPDRLEVTFQETAPPTGVLCAAVITNPAALIVTPHIALPVAFVRVQ